jgi:hypothetical protein
VATVGDKGFEDAVLDHALNSADRQTEHFGGLARAEVVLWVLGCFHGLVPWVVGFVRIGLFGLIEC